MEEDQERKRRLTHRIHTRVTRKKYEELTLLLKQSQGIRTLSELLRHLLDHGLVRVVTLPASPDKALEELSMVRRELSAIGSNINQVTHRFHTEELPASRLLQALEVSRLYQQADLKITEVISLITKIAATWLPE